MGDMLGDSFASKEDHQPMSYQPPMGDMLGDGFASKEDHQPMSYQPPMGDMLGDGLPKKEEPAKAMAHTWNAYVCQSSLPNPKPASDPRLQRALLLAIYLTCPTLSRGMPTPSRPPRPVL